MLCEASALYESAFHNFSNTMYLFSIYESSIGTLGSTQQYDYSHMCMYILYNSYLFGHTKLTKYSSVGEPRVNSKQK